MGYADPFLLGPLGRMRPLPSPAAAGMDAPYERIAGEHRSLRGGTTLDLLNVKRSWAFPFEYKQPVDAHVIIARYVAPLSSEAVRLLDPLVPNRLPLDTSTGGGATGLALGHGVAGGGAVPSRIRPDTRPAVLDGLLDGGFRWEPSTLASDWYLNLDWRLPVLGVEALSFRGWVRGSGAAVWPFLRQYNAAGTFTDTLLASAVTTSSTWAEFGLDVTTAADTISAIVGLHVEAGAAGRVVDLMGPQCGLSADLPAAKWQPGGGAPAVVVVGLDHAYARLGRPTMNLTVREL